MQTAVPILSQVNLFYGGVSLFCHFSLYPFHIFPYYMKDVFLQLSVRIPEILITKIKAKNPISNFPATKTNTCILFFLRIILIPHRFDSENAPYTPYCDPAPPTSHQFPANPLSAFFPASFSRLLRKE